MSARPAGLKSVSALPSRPTSPLRTGSSVAALRCSPVRFCSSSRFRNRGTCGSNLDRSAPVTITPSRTQQSAHRLPVRRSLSRAPSGLTKGCSERNKAATIAIRPRRPATIVPGTTKISRSTRPTPPKNRRISVHAASPTSQVPPKNSAKQRTASASGRPVPGILNAKTAIRIPPRSRKKRMP